MRSQVPSWTKRFRALRQSASDDSASLKDLLVQHALVVLEASVDPLGVEAGEADVRDVDDEDGQADELQRHRS